MRPKIKPASSWILVGFISAEPRQALHSLLSRIKFEVKFAGWPGTKLGPVLILSRIITALLLSGTWEVDVWLSFPKMNLVPVSSEFAEMKSNQNGISQSDQSLGCVRLTFSKAAACVWRSLGGDWLWTCGWS